MVTREMFSAFLSSVMVCDGSMRVPSSPTRTPSTYTQPRSMYSSASRREHRPRSDMSFETRTLCSSGGGKGFGAVTGEGRAGRGAAVRTALPYGLDFAAGAELWLFADTGPRAFCARLARVERATSGRLP